MSVKDMWKSNAMLLFLMVLVDLALFTLGGIAWTILGLLVLLAGMYFSFRQGMGYGHEACAVLQTVERARQPDSPAHGQLDKKTIARAWSVGQGLKGVFASALIPYVLGCLYIASVLLKLEPLIVPARVAALIIAMPFWPVISPWYAAFDRLTPVIAALLMISPFVLPLCCFAGYMRGPKLWRKSEIAMAQGRRRAKAKSRVTKKRSPRLQKPEI